MEGTLASIYCMLNTAIPISISFTVSGSEGFKFTAAKRLRRFSFHSVGFYLAWYRKTCKNVRNSCTFIKITNSFFGKYSSCEKKKCWKKCRQNSGFSNNWNLCRGVFEQLACYTTKYQECDLHLAFILLNLLTLLTLPLGSPTFFYQLLPLILLTNAAN